MRLGKTEVETLRLNGWGVGDVLEGYENGRSDRIWITRLGNEKFGCRIARECNGVWEEEKFNMTLRCREWAKVDHIETTDTARPEWNGEGLPPVGVKAEFSINDGKYWPAVVKYQSSKFYILQYDPGYKGERCYTSDHHIDARPIRTEREKWIESARDIWHEQDEGADNDWGRVYDALVSGDLPMPKTDNRH